MDTMTLTEEQLRALEGFRRHLESDGKAARTVESYCGDVRNFLLHVAGQGRESVTEMVRADVTGFVAGLSGRGFRPATVNKAVSSLSCFEQYLKEARLLPDTARLVEPRRDRVRLAAGSEGEVNVLGQKKVDALLAHVADRNCSQRDALAIHLLLYTGVRVSELVGIRLADLDLAAGLLTVRGKGGKLREVPLRRDTVEAITGYLRGERASGRFSHSERLLIASGDGSCLAWQYME